MNFTLDMNAIIDIEEKREPHLINLNQLINDDLYFLKARCSKLGIELSFSLTPELAVGYRHLGWYHWFLAAWGRSPRENLKKAYGFALKAISLDEYDGLSHGLLGNVYL